MRHCNNPHENYRTLCARRACLVYASKFVRQTCSHASFVLFVKNMLQSGLNLSNGFGHGNAAKRRNIRSALRPS